MTTVSADLNDLLIRLSSVPGDIDTVQQLIKGQYGKRILQFRRTADRSAGVPDADASQLSDWYALAAEVQRRAPQAFRSLLLDPDIASWLESPDCDPGAVGRIAVAGAILARVPTTVVVPVENGELFLPSLGIAVVGTQDADHAVVCVTADRVRITAGGTKISLPPSLAIATKHWRPARWLMAGQKAKLKVRFATDGPVGEVLGAMYGGDLPSHHSAEDWQHALSDAWQILETGHPVHASSIAAGLRAIIPVSPAGKGDLVSATVAGAFGAIALSMPSHPELFAVTMVHEFQHAKLSAALDLIQLYTPDDRTLYYAPWRPDPRPLGALLQGIYAHLGVAQFWGTQRLLTDSSRSLGAHVEFIRWRDDTWQACKDVVSAPSLTRAGDLFVNRLLDELNLLRAEDVPPEAARIADLIALDHKLSWRLRNLEADRQTARRLADAWLNDKASFALSPECVRHRDTPRILPGRRMSVLYRHLSGDTEELRGGYSSADLLYAKGDYHGAFQAYETMIAKAPGDLDAWAGMTLSAAAGGISLHALTARPEVAAEIYQQAASIDPGLKSPFDLAQWLDKAG